MWNRALWLLVAACRPAPSPRAPAPEEHACAAPIPLLAKQHTRNVTRTYIGDYAVVAGEPTVTGLTPITAKVGFVNQPAFGDHGVYFTWRPEGSQADIYLRDLRTGTERGVTCTPEEEYSPAITRDGLVVLRVERDLSRRLVRLGPDGGVRDTLFPGVAGIGAFLWVDDAHVALMISEGDGTRLVLGDPATGAVRPVAEHVTGALAVVPGASALTYVDTAGELPMLTRFDLDTEARTPLVALPEGADRVAALADGSVLAGRGRQLVVATPAAPVWRPVAELAVEGSITRVIVSGGHLAVVTRLD